MNDKSTNHHIYSNIETTRSIARVQGRLSYLLEHQDLPAHFTTVVQQCLDDCQVAHDTHEQTLQHQNDERARILHTAIYSKSPFQVN
jgi:hypothetical protein